MPTRDSGDVAATQLGCFYHTPSCGPFTFLSLQEVFATALLLLYGSTGVCVENFLTAAHNVFQMQPYLTWHVFSRSAVDSRGADF